MSRAARRLWLPIGLLALAACSGSPSDAGAAEDNVAAATPAAPTDSANAAARAEPSATALALDGEGLRLFNPASGSSRAIPFATSRETVTAALAFRGPPSSGGLLEECGAGPLDQLSWRDGLSLYFQDSKFVGWALGGAEENRLTTPAGIGIGSSRAELASAYAASISESTLGTEFEAGSLFGILDGAGADAKITHLWAGTSCNMR